MLSAGCPVRLNWHVFAQRMDKSVLPHDSENGKIDFAIQPSITDTKSQIQNKTFVSGLRQQTINHPSLI